MCSYFLINRFIFIVRLFFFFRLMELFTISQKQNRDNKIINRTKCLNCLHAPQQQQPPHEFKMHYTNEIWPCAHQYRDRENKTRSALERLFLLLANAKREGKKSNGTNSNSGMAHLFLSNVLCEKQVNFFIVLLPLLLLLLPLLLLTNRIAMTHSIMAMCTEFIWANA